MPQTDNLIYLFKLNLNHNHLRYSAIMTAKAVVTLSVSAWAVSVVLVGVLVSLSVRLSRCTSVIPNFYCDNASLFKLSCEDVSINNIYGLFYTVVLLSSSMGIVAGELAFRNCVLYECDNMCTP